jgi:hypothetical protein
LSSVRLIVGSAAQFFGGYFGILLLVGPFDCWFGFVVGPVDCWFGLVQLYGALVFMFFVVGRYNCVCIVVVAKKSDLKNIPLAMSLVPNETKDNFL